MTRRNAGEGNIRQRPNGRWEARYVAADGRSRSLYGTTKREVTDRLRAALRDADDGLKPLDKRLTTGRYLTSWLEEYAAPSVRATTLTSYRHMVDGYLIPSIGTIPLAELQPEHVQRMLATLAAKGKRRTLSATTVRYAYSVLRIALGRAKKLGKVRENVATLIDPPAKARRDLQPLSAEQVRAFMTSLQPRQAEDGTVVPAHRLAPLFLAAVATGLRQGELLGLRWSDVDLDAGALMVRHTLQRGTQELAEPKTHNARRAVPLPRSVVESLRQHRKAQRLERVAAGSRWKDRDFVFPSAVGTPLEPRNVLRAFHAALDAAGMPHQPFHHLRHAYATLQLEAGEELANVSKILGHADLGTTANLYAHLTPTIHRRAAERMDAILAG